MTDIARALAQQAKLDAEATPAPWTRDSYRLSGNMPGFRPGGEKLADFFIRVGAHTPYALDEANAALIAHLRNQAALAREVLWVAALLHECQLLGPPFDRDLDNALKAWADHVNGETP